MRSPLCANHAQMCWSLAVEKMRSPSRLNLEREEGEGCQRQVLTGWLSDRRGTLCALELEREEDDGDGDAYLTCVSARSCLFMCVSTDIHGIREKIRAR